MHMGRYTENGPQCGEPPVKPEANQLDVVVVVVVVVIVRVVALPAIVAPCLVNALVARVAVWSSPHGW